MGESSKRSSRRASGERSSSKRLSKRREQAKEAFNAAKMAGQAAATAWTYGAMTVMFLIVYVAHAAMDYINKQVRATKLSKRDEVLLMGKIFRRSSAFFVVDLNPFWSLSVTVEEPLESMPTAIYMSNHLSFADAFVLCAAQRPVESKYVGKADLWDLPVMGKAMHHAGDMPVYFKKDKKTGRWRTKTGSTEALMEQARGYLENDVPITVFPEGSISRETNELMPFKKGFFRLAVVTGKPIVPVAMWGTQHAWPNQSGADVSQGSILLAPAEIHVRFGAPIASAGKSVPDLMVEVYTKIQDMRNALPNCDLDPSLAIRDPKALFLNKQDSVPALDDAPGDATEDEDIRVEEAA